MEQLKILSLNINGLNSPTKRSKTFNYLRKQKLDIICLQETHIKKAQDVLLGNKWLGNLFTASAEVKKRGVAIYIKPPNLQITDRLTDPEGRYIFLKIRLPDNSIWTLANLYAPNSGKEVFLMECLRYFRILQRET